MSKKDGIMMRLINVLIMIMLLVMSTPVNNVAAETSDNPVENSGESLEVEETSEESLEVEEASDTNWVYDESQSISEETINLINHLNENELKVNQYGVVIVKTMGGQSMDSFKLDLFNSLGVGHSKLNAGILFVIATEDREYGIEIGDGLQGQAREVFEADLVGRLAMDELKAGDWDGVVYKVSSALPKVVEIQDIQTSMPVENNSYDMSYLIEIQNMVFYSLVTIVGLMLLAFPASYVNKTIKINSFLKQGYVKAFMDMNGFTKKSLKNKLIEEGYYTITKENLYKYSIREIYNNLYELYQEEDLIDIEIVKDIFAYSDFEENARKSIKRNTSSVKREYDIYLAEESRKIDVFNEHIRQNKIWAEEIMKEERISDRRIVEMTSRAVEEMPKLDKEELREWMMSEEKAMLVEYEVYELFDGEDANRILKDIKSEKGYRRYISGEVDSFEPSKSDYNRDYYNENRRRENSLVNNSNYWLWIYGLNHRNKRMKSERAMSSYSSSNKSSNSRKSSSSSSSSFNNFGSGFGGGFSSGGGSSGSF